MRVVLHDYAGHPFQVQLSRELARRGHVVHHFYFSNDITPRGALARQPHDPAGLTISGIGIPGHYDKFSYWKRVFYNRAYGAKVAAAIQETAPDVVINTNVPIDALALIQSRCRAPDRRFVVWLQDVFSTGVRNVLRKKAPFAADLVAWRYQRLERSVMREADHVVSITADFLPLLQGWGIDAARCSVIENWAPLDEITPLPQDNDWAREHGLAGRTVLLYSGTLALKHDPAGIAHLARHVGQRPEVKVVVVSQGPGADWLAAEQAKGGLDNLLLLPFQPYERFSAVLAAATVVLAVIEPEAGVFAVPSKVLSYLAAGRPVLLAVPPENLAARTTLAAEAGLVVSPGDHGGLARALDRLLDEPLLRARLGRNARAYAERTFDIGAIADRFEALCQPAKAATARAA